MAHSPPPPHFHPFSSFSLFVKLRETNEAWSKSLRRRQRARSFVFLLFGHSFPSSSAGTSGGRENAVSRYNNDGGREPCATPVVPIRVRICVIHTRARARLTREAKAAGAECAVSWAHYLESFVPDDKGSPRCRKLKSLSDGRQRQR